MDPETHTASFGYWVRRRRKALDLTQEALAQRVGCAVVTIKKIEADERRPSRQIAERLAVVLAIPAEEHDLFLRCARGQATPLRLPIVAAPIERPSGPPTHNLPAPVTALIGREQEVAYIAALLREPSVRLVTLTGPGGVGKTRLALEVAQELLSAFGDGALFVDLASVGNPEQVAATIAEAVGLKDKAGQPASAALQDALRPKRLLLLLDNFEHVLEAAPIAAKLLAAAPGLTILATSRAPLHLSGEYERAVPPLAASAATALFAERARAVDPGFALTATTLPVVEAICRRLDELPLAIELAAPHCKLWTVGALLQHLERRLPLLMGGPRDRPARQQTLRQTLDWSYDLLDEAERRLFACLSVFMGSWTAEAAAHITSDAESCGTTAESQQRPSTSDTLAITLGWLGSLADKSLIQKTLQGGEPRFSMLETVREYAQERLTAGTEADQARQRHMDYFVELVETIEDQVYRGLADEAVFLRRLADEHDNIRAALAWAFAGHHPEHGARLAAAMKMFWYIHGHLHEGRRWLEQALRLVRVPGETRAAVLIGAGVLTWQQGDYVLARTYIEESLGVWRRPGLEHSRELAFALHILGHVRFDQRDYAAARPLFAESLAINHARGESIETMALIGDLGLVACHLGDYAEARTHFEQGLARARARGSRDGVAVHLVRLGDLARLEGDNERATPMYEESLALCREIGDVLDIASSLHKLGQVARRRGDYERARDLLAESLSLQQAQGNQQGIIECMAGLAGMAVNLRQPEIAARLFGTAEALLHTLGAPLAPADQREWDRDVAELKAFLIPDILTTAWAAGRTLASEGVEAATAEILHLAAGLPLGGAA